MKNFRKELLNRGAAVFLVAVTIGGALPALGADPAQTLFSEAMTLTTKARGEKDPAAKAGLATRALGNLDRIVAEHPDSKLAELLRQGKPIGTFDRKMVEQILVEAGGTLEPKTAATATPPAPVPLAAPAPAPAPAATADAPPASPPAVTAAPADPAVTATPAPAARAPRLPVDADPATPAGRLLTDVATTLDALFAGGSQPVYPSVREPLRVTQDGERHVVKVRGLAFNIGSGRVDVGDLDLGVKPLPDDKGFVLDFALPSEVAMVNGTTTLMALTIAESAVTATWRSDIGMVTSGSFDVKGLRGLIQQGDRMAEIYRLDAAKGRQTDAEADGTISITGSMEALGMQVVPFMPSQPRVALKRLAVDSEARRVNIEAMKLLQAIAGFKAITTPPDPDRVVEQLLDLLANGSWEGLKLAYTVEGLTVGEEAQPLVSAERLRIGVDLDNGGALAGGQIDLEGKSIVAPMAAAMAEIPADLMPHSFALSTQLTALPVKPMATLAKGDPKGGPEKAGGMMAMPAIQQAAFEAKPALVVKAVSLAAPKAEAGAAGTLTLDAEAKNLVSGAFDVQVAGLDAIKAHLDKVSARNPAAAEMTPAVVLLRGLGQPGKIGEREAHSYNVQVNRDGSITINGTPWESLIPRKRF